MSLHLVSVEEVFVRVCVVDATDDNDARITAARVPREAWRMVYAAWPLIEVQPLNGVPLEDDPA